MAEINQLIDDIDADKLDKLQTIEALYSINGYLAVIDAEGDKEEEE